MAPPTIAPGATYPSQVKKLAEEKPDKEAYVFYDKDFNKTVLTRKDVWDTGRKFAAILRRHGVQKGDIVCDTLVNSPERIITSFGALVAGAVTMHGIVFLADGEDLIHNCKTARCKAIVVDPGDSKGAWPILERIRYTDDVTGAIKYKSLPDMTTVISVNVCHPGTNDVRPYVRGLRVIEEEEDMFEETSVSEDGDAFIFSTSGTTGFSKLVPHTHRGSLFQGKLQCDVAGIQSEDSRMFLDRSLGWLGGFPGTFPVYGNIRILTDLSRGAPEKIDEHLMRIMNEEEVDCAGLMPPEVEVLLKSISSGRELKRKLNSFGTGGMPLTRRSLRPLGVLADGMTITYGSTEVGYATVLHLHQDTSFEDFCAGSPVEGTEIKIVDKNGDEVSRREIGEVAVRSSAVTAGYVNEPEKTKKAFMKDGFFLMGDNAYMDEKGEVYVMGRQINAIHKGIFIHYPGWIESRILKCPGVEHAIVLDVPDPVCHHEICACVIPEEGATITEEQLHDYCRTLLVTDENSAMSAVPKYYLFYSSYPPNSNGKLDRNILRQDAIQRLNITQDASSS